MNVERLFKMKRCAIDMPGGRISAGKRSHKAAWAYLRAHQLKIDGYDVKVLHKGESWDDYDVIFLYHGMEFQGSLNLFGGASDATALLFKRMLDFKGVFVSLDIPMPDYGELCKGRLKKCEPEWSSMDWDALSELCGKIPVMRTPLKSSHLVLGDSHAFSAYVPGAMVARMDCKTLHGALQMQIPDLVELHLSMWGIPGAPMDTLTLYFGNIDVRHHLCRFSDRESKVREMVEEYEKQIKATGIRYVEIVELLPIENESRKLPKTGYYKGEPFHGAWTERTSIRMYVNRQFEKMVERNPGWSMYRHPKEIVNEKGELDFAAMEVPRSVHLSPEYYRTNLREENPEGSFFSEFF
jgi:hypothetical protein